jgi:hypothetical protein
MIKTLYTFTTSSGQKLEVYASQRRRYGSSTITWLRCIVDSDYDNNIEVSTDPFPAIAPPKSASLWALRAAGYDIEPTPRDIHWLNQMKNEKRFTEVSAQDASTFTTIAKAA